MCNKTKMPEGCATNYEKNLIYDLLRCYDKRVRPVMNYHDALDVGFDVQLQQIIDLVSYLLFILLSMSLLLSK